MLAPILRPYGEAPRPVQRKDGTLVQFSGKDDELDGTRHATRRPPLSANPSPAEWTFETIVTWTRSPPEAHLGAQVGQRLVGRKGSCTVIARRPVKCALLDHIEGSGAMRLGRSHMMVAATAEVVRLENRLSV